MVNVYIHDRIPYLHNEAQIIMLFGFIFAYFYFYMSRVKLNMDTQLKQCKQQTHAKSLKWLLWAFSISYMRRVKFWAVFEREDFHEKKHVPRIVDGFQFVLWSRRAGQTGFINRARVICI